MEILYFILAFFIIFFVIIFLYINYINKKIIFTEKQIQKSLKERSDLIPSLFEISKDYLVKHSEVFKEIIRLRKVQFTLNQYEVTFIEFVKNEIAINHEIRFIYNISNKNKKLSGLKKFDYIKNLIIEKNKVIWTNMDKYKKYINKYNNLIKLKNFSILWFFYNKDKRLEIDLVKSIF